MNILFFLSPKQYLMYVYDDFTLRQTLEKWENNRYASIPVLNRRGEYVGTLTEGDILWGLKKYQNFVPVVDDRGIFIGIVRRQAIIRYCYEKSREEKASQPGRVVPEYAAAH